MRATAGLLVVAMTMAGLGGAIVAAPPAAAEGEGRVRFTDVTEASGITFQRQLVQGPYWLQNMADGGVAVGDVDGDGWEDLYFTQANPLQAEDLPEPLRSQVAEPSALYRNNGDGTFTDITARAGVGGYGIAHAAVFADYDNDLDQDLLVTNSGGLQLFRNRGGGAFDEVTHDAGLDVTEMTCMAESGRCWYTGAAWADADADGCLDLYVTQYQVWVWFVVDPRPDPLKAAPNLFFHSRCDGTFVERAAEAGIQDPLGWGWMAAWHDYDRDGLPDLFVANDFTPDKFFHNDGNLRFTDVTSALGADYTGNSMGVVWMDVDRDRDLDVVTTEMMAPEIFYNHDDGARFEPVPACLVNLNNTMLYFLWGIVPFDADLDGLEDVFMTHGSANFNDGSETTDTTDKGNFLYLALPDGMWLDVTLSSGVESWISGRGAARTDYDRDGDDDIIVASATGGHPLLLRNDSPRQGNSLQLLLHGTASNRDAVGAEVLITTSTGEQLRSVAAGDSFESGQSRWITVSLGDDTAARVDVRWPSGLEQTFHVNQGAWHLTEGSGGAVLGGPGADARGEMRFRLDPEALARPGATVLLALQDGDLLATVFPYPLPTGLVLGADVCETDVLQPECSGALGTKTALPYGIGMVGSAGAIAPGATVQTRLAFLFGGGVTLTCRFDPGQIHFGNRAPNSGSCQVESVDPASIGPWLLLGAQQGMLGPEFHVSYGSPYM